MRSKQMWVRCGLLAVVVMSASVSAAPSPGQLWPSMVRGIAGLEVTEIPQLEKPRWAYDVTWYGAVVIYLWSPTPGATIRYTTDGTVPSYFVPSDTSRLYVYPLLILKDTILIARVSAPGWHSSEPLVLLIDMP